MAAKKKSTAAKAAKARNKAYGSVSYSYREGNPKVFGDSGSVSGSKNREKLERAKDLGAKVDVKYSITNYGGRAKSMTARKPELAATNEKTMKSSGMSVKSTARQIATERSRTATRATAIAKRVAKAKKK